MTRKEQLRLAYMASEGIRYGTPAVQAGRLLFGHHKGDLAKAIADAKLTLLHLETVEDEESAQEFAQLCAHVDAVNESATQLLRPPYLRLVVNEVSTIEHSEQSKETR